MPPSTTPHGLPIRTPASVGQPSSPTLVNKSRSPPASFASPGYFGLSGEPAANPTDVGLSSSRKHRVPSSGTPRASAFSPKGATQDPPFKFEAFRRQSELNSFNLHHGNISQLNTMVETRRSSSSKSPDSAKSRRDSSSHSRPRKKPSLEKERDIQSLGTMEILSSAADVNSEPSSITHGRLFADSPLPQSPANDSSLELSKLGRNQASYLDERHPRNSLPENRVDPHPLSLKSAHRAETLPTGFSTDGPTMISAQSIEQIIKNHLPPDLLIIDVRVFAHYSQARVAGALNLNLSTILLKRSTYDVQRLSGTFTKPHEQAKFDQWRNTKFIIVYDANSAQLKDATTCVHTLKKFTNEGWRGSTLIIKGGFNSFSKYCPSMIERGSREGEDSPRKLSIDATKPVAGGCLIPENQTAAMPFFSAIRQNMDLRDGVGQIVISIPPALNEKGISELPGWLKRASDERDKGKAVSTKFLTIERAEQKRMQQAYSANVSYGSPDPKPSKTIQIAGIEKGVKNRYKDMLPYDHSRVRLQNKPAGDCDYVNASHIKAEWSNKHYIASQAPVPATFEDFWSVAWQQDVRVIVMLTAESEGGQIKCHPYWLPNNYGSLRVQSIGEKRVSLEPTKQPSSEKMTFQPSSGNDASGPVRTECSSPELRSHGRRRSTTFSSSASSLPGPASPPLDPSAPHVIIRKLMLSHDGQPYAPMREITQLQYTSWPDFGAPAHPLDVMGLVEKCGEVIRSYGGFKGNNKPAPEGERPIVVHCSAGCGRTGTFCTVDSVIDMMKRQQQARFKNFSPDMMDVDQEEKNSPWIISNDNDLVVKTVEDFRLQRLSMVQTLRQFVLCYETVLEWMAAQMPEGNLRKQTAPDRRSYQG
ncbi:MAG: hypothetical protein LQ352_000583 [Teloschistes flavicans]|nr:MAG: hypothetical protein LQ352_000583 [Teloschistes flavicans]